MNKEFVPYEQALALKELGFDEPCFGWWLIAGDGAKEMLILEKCELNSTGICLAPLYQQAFRWFREKYMLSSAFIPCVINHRDNTMIYTYNIDGKYHTSVSIGTFEEAELACLNKLIEIVKQKL